MKAVLFDYDGVLVDSLQAHIDIYRDISREMQLRLDPNIFTGDFFEMDWRKTLRSIGVSDDERTRRAETIYRQNIHMLRKDIQVFDGIKEIIPRLSKKYRLAVVSNSVHKTIKKKLEEECIAGYFEIIMGPFDGYAKPSPEPLLECLRRMNIRPQDAAYVGDMDGDIEAAKAAGLRSIAVTYGYHSKNKLSSADAIARSPIEIEEAIS